MSGSDKAAGRPGWVCIDVETTGIDESEDEILQLAIVGWDGEPLYLSLFRPAAKRRWPEAAAINGITPESVAGAPSLADELPAIQAVVDASEGVCIYNAAFDMRFLAEAGVDLSGKDVIDAMVGFARAYGEWSESRRTWRFKKLGFAAAHVGYGEFEAHDALEDCRAAIAVQNWLDGLDWDAIAERNLLAMRGGRSEKEE